MDQHSFPIKITICIATCKRKDYLTILLTKLEEVVLPNNVIVKVTIADNDPEKSAEALILNIAGSYRFPIVYGSEPQRGIPFTRNKAVSLADNDSDFIVFIDDDEYPEKEWLIELLSTQQRMNADVVQGPSLPKYEETPPSWVVKGGFHVFSLYNLKEGDKQPHDQVATNNLLVKFEKLKQLDGPFNEKMGLIGCDDTDLGLNLHALGCKMVYTNKALVYEFIPKQRTTVKWLMQRAYRSANTYWLLCREKSFLNFAKLLIGAITRIIFGALLLAPALIMGVFIGFQYFYKLIRLIVRGVAIINGLFGSYYEEYKVAYTYNK